VFVPLKTAVGLGFTVITAFPIIPAGAAAHLLSFTAVNVYVLFVTGDTVNEYELVLILLTVTGTAPSV
jgi:hypothetical protein